MRIVVPGRFDSPRSISALATFRDTRLVFDPVATADPAELIFVRSARMGTGILRLGLSEAGLLYYQHITDASAPWPAWGNGGFDGKPGSGIGMYTNPETGRVGFVLQRSDGAVCYGERGVGDGAFATLVEIFSNFRAFPNSVLGFGYASGAHIYVYQIEDGMALLSLADVTLGADMPYIEYFPGSFSGGSGYYDFKTGQIDKVTPMGFDAVSLFGVDHIVIPDSGGKRAWHLTVAPLAGAVSNWSQVKPVIPLDVVDDLSYFRPYQLSVVGSRVFLTGNLSRTDGAGFDAYTILDDNLEGWTLGRDLYIQPGGLVSGETVMFGETVSYPKGGGGFVQVGTQLYYTGINSAAKAEASMLVVTDNANLKYGPVAINDLTLGSEGRSPTSIRFSLPSSTPAHTAIRPGAEVTLEIKDNNTGYKLHIGKFGVDTVPSSTGPTGKDLAVQASSDGIKRLSQWYSDASYDYWSQTRQKNWVAELGAMNCTSGKFIPNPDDPYSLIPDKAYTNCFLITTQHAGRGNCARATFTIGENPTITEAWGVVVNYHQETQEEADAAANPVGIVEGIELPSAGYPRKSFCYGLVCDKTMLSLHRMYIEDGVFPESIPLLGELPPLYSVPMPEGMTAITLELTYQDGELRARFRSPLAVEWTNLFTYQLWKDDNGWWQSPYYKEPGRGGIFMRADIDSTMLGAIGLSAVAGFEYYTTDVDLRLEDMVREIARKAGVKLITAEKTLGAGQLITIDRISASFIDWAKPNRLNPIVRFKPNWGANDFVDVGIVGDYGGWILRVKQSRLELLQITEVMPYQEAVRQYIDVIPITGWVTVSCYNGTFSVWVNGRYQASFYTDDQSHLYTKTSIGGHMSFFEMDWSACDSRVDNYILDMGRTGIDLINELIGMRRFYYRDSQGAGFYLFRNRVEINTIGVPYPAVIEKTAATTDAGIATRLRAEGIDISEQADYTNLKEYGNHFRVVNIPFPETKGELDYEASLLLADGIKRANQFRILLVPNLVVEPNDILYVQTPGETRKVVIDSVNLALSTTDISVVYDQSMEAHDA